jgi:outer membrane protein, adhesin transport system
VAKRRIACNDGEMRYASRARADSHSASAAAVSGGGVAMARGASGGSAAPAISRGPVHDPGAVSLAGPLRWILPIRVRKGETTFTRWTSLRSSLVGLSVAAMPLVPAHGQEAAQPEPFSNAADNGVVYGPPGSSPSVAALPGSPQPPGVPAALASVVARAASGYPSVQAARAGVRAAGQDLRAARHQRLPSVSVEAVGFTGGSEYAADNNFALNLTVDQPVWDGGRIGSGIRRAKAQREVALAEVEQERQRLALRTVDAYFDLVRTAQRDAILRQSYAAHEELAASIGRRVDMRISARSDLTLAQARLAQIRQQQAGNTAQRLNALQTLEQLSGADLDDLGGVPPYDPQVHNVLPEGLVERAVACDPVAQRLGAEEAVARAEAERARAEIYPQLSAQFSSNEITGERVGLVLRAQTGGGLSQFAAYEAATTRVAVAAQRRAAQERELRQAVQADLLLNASTLDQIAASQDARTGADEVTASYRRQFAAGLRTWLDVMNSVREVMSAELSAGDARIEAMATHARLLLRSCLWQPDGPDTAGDEP